MTGAPLRIAMVSDSGNSGGAGIAAARLAEGLQRRGHHVTRILPRAEESTGPTIGIAPAYSTSLGFRAAARVARIADPFRWSDYWSRTWLNDKLAKLRPDVISVHNLHGCNWPAEFLSDCMAHAPTAWTLHDCWSFTGRCVYPGKCGKYPGGCDASCPTASEYPALPPARIAPAWRRRQRMLDQHPSLLGVTPSRWLQRVAQEGLWRGHEVKVIANGLALDVYRPGDREKYRLELGIATGPVMLAASQDLSDPRKGLGILWEALQKQTRPLTLLTFGSGTIPVQLPGNIRLKELGPIREESTKMRAFNAADIYVHPALEDNLPNTVAESIACGTPVVAFDVGGLSEMVLPGVTGWLAGAPGAESLATALDIALDSPLDRARCRQNAELRYDLDRCSVEYEDTLRSLTERHTGGVQ